MAVSTGQGEDDVMSTINITPFTDVLLVLLIIFIILASVTKEPTLPDAHNREKVVMSQIIVRITDKNVVSIGAREVNIRDASQAFADIQASTGGSSTSVIIKADPHADYGLILQVMDAAKSQNITEFGLANHIEGTPQGSVQ